jgi:hypothetical protein
MRWRVLPAILRGRPDWPKDEEIGKEGKPVNALNERDIQQHVTILGWLHIIANALFLLLGLVGLLFFAGIGIVTGDPTAMGVLGILGLVAALFFGVLALPGILAGYGLLKRQKWGQILGIVVGLLSLVNFPIGTAIGLYTLFVLLQDAATSYFASQGAAADNCC